jgi:hypothetical protein
LFRQNSKHIQEEKRKFSLVGKQKPQQLQGQYGKDEEISKDSLERQVQEV